jgi:hypothetical protein
LKDNLVGEHRKQALFFPTKLESVNAKATAGGRKIGAKAMMKLWHIGTVCQMIPVSGLSAIG